jgi:hypothetical protein
MKRILLLATLIVLLPLAAFAELGVGGVALYNSPVLLGQSVDEDELNVNKFTLGGDMRFKLSLFQAEGMLLYSAGEVQSLDIFLDGGVAFDILMLRLSAGVGPNFTVNIGEDKVWQNGLNFKLNADVKIKRLSIGLTYITDLNLDGGIDIDTSAGLLGATVLLWL